MAKDSITLSYARFSYDSTSLFIATSEEVKMYGLKDSALLYETKIKDSTLVVQIYGTGILCVVTKADLTKMHIISMSENKILDTKKFPADILDIKSNRSVMVVGCRDSLNVFEILQDGSGFKGIFRILKENKHYNGLFALSQVPDGPNYCALPSSNKSGDVDIYDIELRGKKTTVRAHKSDLVALAFHPTEQVLATASKKGTVIRLISIPTGTNLCEFRRGLQRNASIYSLSFSNESNFLISSGSTGTVHVFKFELPGQQAEEKSWTELFTGAIKSSANYILGSSTDLSVDTRYKQGWTSYFGGMIASSANFIPNQMYEVYNQVRSFLKIRLAEGKIRNISTIARVQGKLHVVVFTEDSFVSVFDMTEGEEGKLVSKHSPLIGHSPTMVINNWKINGDEVENDNYEGSESSDVQSSQNNN